MSDGDEVIVLRSVAGIPATKTFRRNPADGSVTKLDFGRARTFSVEVRTVASVHDLAALLAELERDRLALVIRGRLLAHTDCAKTLRRRAFSWFAIDRGSRATFGVLVAFT